MLTLILAAAIADQPAPSGPPDAKLTRLGDGYMRVETQTYIIEVPEGWGVTRETPWGQRDAAPEGAKGKLGVMTAPPGRQSWDSLYRTSLYFITRDEPGRATPYELTKLKSGLEAMTFTVRDAEGFDQRRYVLVRDEKKGLLALSVRIPGPSEAEIWKAHFQRMVDSARFK